MQTDQRELLHVKEAASVLGVHEITIRRAIARGDLEAVKLGNTGRLRVSRQQLERYLKPTTGNPR